jgi:hypothetical protein
MHSSPHQSRLSSPLHLSSPVSKAVWEHCMTLYTLPSRSVRLPVRHRIPLPRHSPTLGSPPPCAPHANNYPIPIVPHWNLLPAQGTRKGCTPPLPITQTAPSTMGIPHAHMKLPLAPSQDTGPCQEHPAHPQNHSLVRSLPSLSMPAHALLCK